MSAFSKFQADFDNMSDNDVISETRRMEDQLAQAEEWLEAVEEWQAAGKPRRGTRLMTDLKPCIARPAEARQASAENGMPNVIMSAADCDLILAALRAPEAGAGGVPVAWVSRVMEQREECAAEGVGAWLACSGCQESEDGYVSSLDYPYSAVFGCQPGGGCSECGGLGVKWDTTNWDEAARFMLDLEENASPVLPDREGIARIIHAELRRQDGEDDADPSDSLFQRDLTVAYIDQTMVDLGRIADAILKASGAAPALDRDAILEQAAVAVAAHDRTGREWVKGSLWDAITQEAVDRIRALKDCP